MEFHEYAEFFPMMEGEEFENLVKDIRENGLLEPIVTFEGKILDGRNRFLACGKAGIEPRFREHQDGDALSYVWSKNAIRRHLNKSQLALIRIEMSDIGVERQRPSRELATSEISDRTIRQVRQIKREAPDLIPGIRGGEMSADGATIEIRQRRAKKFAQEDIAREDRRERQENPREVAEYLEAVDSFRGYLDDFYEAIETAVDVAIWGKFSPEAEDFVTRRHDRVREQIQSVLDMMKRVEEVFNEEEAENE